MTNINPDKLECIEAYFSDLRAKVERIQKLVELSFKDEAMVLCLVYIDYLASGMYYDGIEKNKFNFCRALIGFGDSIFGMIHPQRFVDAAANRSEKIKSAVYEIADRLSGRFVSQDQIRQLIEESPVSGEEKKSIVENLWRASGAAICYDYMRCAGIHGPGVTTALSFSLTKLDDQFDGRIDFTLLYRSLESILNHVETISLKTGEFFGNPKYTSEKQ